VAPVDGGPARDLRASTHRSDPARQLTGLFATAHRPDACAPASFPEIWILIGTRPVSDSVVIDDVAHW
jgi:hypothetical protein